MYNLWCFLTIVLAIVGMFFAIKTVMFISAWWYRQISKLKIQITIVLFGVFTTAACLAQAQTYVGLKHMADSGYMVVLNGEEVNKDTIKFYQYTIRIDNNAKLIFLT